MVELRGLAEKGLGESSRVASKEPVEATRSRKTRRKLTGVSSSSVPVDENASEEEDLNDVDWEEVCGKGGERGELVKSSSERR